MIIFSVIIVLALIYFIIRESRPEWVKGYLITIGILTSILLISVTTAITQKLLDLPNITIFEDDISITNQEGASLEDIQRVKELIRHHPVSWKEMNGEVWVGADGMVYLTYDYEYDNQKVEGLVQVYNGEIKYLK